MLGDTQLAYVSLVEINTKKNFGNIIHDLEALEMKVTHDLKVAERYVNERDTSTVLSSTVLSSTVYVQHDSCTWKRKNPYIFSYYEEPVLSGLLKVT